MKGTAPASLGTGKDISHSKKCVGLPFRTVA